MPARLVPQDAIPKLAEQVDSPAMLRALQHLQKVGYIMNGSDVSSAAAAVLQRLTDLGLVDPAYEGETRDKPSMWVGNGNGLRVLRYLEASPPSQAALASNLKMDPRARTALSALSEWEQAEILAAVDALRQRDPASWDGEGVVRLGGDKQVYLLRPSSDLRAFVRVLDSGEIELFDIMPEETLQLFLKRYGSGARVG